MDRKQCRSGCQRSVVMALALVLGVPNLVFAQQSPPNQGAPTTGRGVFVYTLNYAIGNDPAAASPNAPARELLQAMSVPGIDGITLVVGWNDIEPSCGNYVWGDDPTTTTRSWFDNWILQAANAGLQINLAIRTTSRDTSSEPGWLFDGACAVTQGYSFVVSPHQGNAKGSKADCQVVRLAAPWDETFLSNWDAMLKAVSNRLHSLETAQNASAYDAVTQVRLTGINRTTDEFRLPEENLSSRQCSSVPPGVSLKSLETWLSAGYTPDRLAYEWRSILKSFLTYFPDKQFNLPIIPDGTGGCQSACQPQYPLPEIGSSGCVYSPPVPPSDVPSGAPICGDQFSDDILALLQQAIGMITASASSGGLTLEFESLDCNSTAVGSTSTQSDWCTSGNSTETNVPANQMIPYYAWQVGAGMAYMTNNFLAANRTNGGGGGTGDVVGAACSGGYAKPKSCTSNEYMALLEAGIWPDPLHGGTSNFIEVLPPDAVNKADDIAYAHYELFQGRKSDHPCATRTTCV